MLKNVTFSSLLRHVCGCENCRCGERFRKGLNHNILNNIYKFFSIIMADMSEKMCIFVSAKVCPKRVHIVVIGYVNY